MGYKKARTRKWVWFKPVIEEIIWEDPAGGIKAHVPVGYVEIVDPKYGTSYVPRDVFDLMYEEAKDDSC